MVEIPDVTLLHGDSLALLPTLEAGSVEAVVTDPPAGIGFMGKEWDDFRRARNTADVGREDVFGRTSRTGPEFGRRSRDQFIAFLSAVFTEVRRVIKPGGYALVWAIPRTSHWTATALEEAGWEIRDRISHIFGSGFPKGNGCLKPAVEDWWLCRAPGKGVRPLGIDETRINPASSSSSVHGRDGFSPERVRDALLAIVVALRACSTTCKTLLRNGDGRGDTEPSGERCGETLRRLFPSGVWCGLIWCKVQDLEGCCPSCCRSGDELLHQVQAACREGPPSLADVLERICRGLPERRCSLDCQCSDRPSSCGVLRLIASWGDLLSGDTAHYTQQSGGGKGRWPANLVLDEAAARLLDEQSGESADRPARYAVSGEGIDDPDSRLTYEAGWNGKTCKTGYATAGGASRFFFCSKASKSDRGKGNTHPTVKSLSLMSWLVKLVCPEGGVVLDPFAGSGSTLVAALSCGRRSIGIEKDPDYFAIAQRRIAEARASTPLFDALPELPVSCKEPAASLFDGLEDSPS